MQAQAQSENNKPPSQQTQRLILDLLGTAEQTSSAGGNKTGLLSLDGVSGDGRGLTDMLMVTL
jgi:hypothetical protein